MANPVAVPGTVVSSGAAVSPGGAQGVTGTPAWTTNTAGFTIPNVGSTVSVTVADASWIVVGEMLYVDQAGGGVGLSGVLQVQSKSGNTLTLLNPTPAPAIPSADNTQAGLLNRLSGNTGDYVGGDNACHSIAAISAFVTKTAAYTLTAADSGKYVICLGGSWTLTLPAPVVGFNFRLRNDMGISGTTGTITLQPNGGTIDGQTSILLLPQQECTLITDSTNWRTHGLKREVILGTQDITTSTAFGSVLLPVGYRYFELEFDGAIPVTSGDFMVGQLSTNGGSTWIATGYYHGVLYNNTATTTTFNDIENGSSFFLMPQQANSIGGLCKLRLYPLTPSWTIDAGSRNTVAYQVKWNGFGIVTPASPPVNAIKYNFSASNISNCFLTVKGVV
jgi:hypothetical protein